MAIAHQLTKFAGLGLGMLLLGGCWGTRSELPPVHLVLNMDDQQKFDPQEDNEFFGDKRAMRLPVEGTVAIGKLRDDDHLYRGRDANGRLVDGLPSGIQLDDALLARGEERYGIYCSPCHGGSGLGDGVATRRGGGFQVAPKNLHEPRLKAMPLGYFYKVISEGQGTMLSYAAQITEPRDRWAIAAWVRVLQRSDIPQPEPAAAAADAKGSDQ